jgi:hypothetical protein
MARRHARLIGIEVRAVPSETMRRLDVEHLELVQEHGSTARALQQTSQARPRWTIGFGMVCERRMQEAPPFNEDERVVGPHELDPAALSSVIGMSSRLWGRPAPGRGKDAVAVERGRVIQCCPQ